MVSAYSVWWRKRWTCSRTQMTWWPFTLSFTVHNDLFLTPCFSAYSVWWLKWWTCSRTRMTWWPSTCSSISSASPPPAPTQYSMASSMTTLRRSGSLHMCFSLVLSNLLNKSPRGLSWNYKKLIENSLHFEGFSSDEINHCRDMVNDHFVLSFPPDTVDGFYFVI